MKDVRVIVQTDLSFDSYFEILEIVKSKTLSNFDVCSHKDLNVFVGDILYLDGKLLYILYLDGKLWEFLVSSSCRM